MFDFLKKKKQKEKIVIAIHGFGRKRNDEFLNLVNYLETKNIKVVSPVLFDQSNIQDNNYLDWINRAIDSCREYLDHDIIIVGYSMGGVIASYIASKIKVQKLILLSPAFDWMNTKTVKKAVVDLVIKKEEIDDGYIKLPSNFYDTFKTICSNFKNSISEVSCPVVLFHGTSDETIPHSSSKWAYSQIHHDKKIAIFIEEGTHHLIDDNITGPQVLDLIYHYIQKEA